MSKPKKAADTGRTPMDAALRYLGARARTAREVERHLDACEYGEVEIYDTVERLKELGLVNDLSYAQEFVRTRLATKPISRSHLKEQLLAHEVEQDAIDQALAQVDDDSQRHSAAAVADKYARQYARLPEKEREEMVLRRLLSRGYSYDDARAAMHEMGKEEE